MLLLLHTLGFERPRCIYQSRHRCKGYCPSASRAGMADIPCCVSWKPIRECCPHKRRGCHLSACAGWTSHCRSSTSAHFRSHPRGSNEIHPCLQGSPKPESHNMALISWLGRARIVGRRKVTKIFTFGQAVRAQTSQEKLKRILLLSLSLYNIPFHNDVDKEFPTAHVMVRQSSLPAGTAALIHHRSPIG